MSVGDLWNLILLEPMLNLLIMLSKGFFNNFGLTIIAFTIIVRLLMLPLTLRQLRAAKAMSSLQPKMQVLQKKHAKDRTKLNQELMKLYKEHGVNPLGCAVPMLIQFPIWIALYQSVIQALAATPEALEGLSRHVYSWLSIANETIPLNNHFLWLDLAQRDPTSILAILVAGSMWVQQKMMTTATTDPRQQATNQMMQWMMPLMFGFFTLSFASGLALYWFTSNIISIVMQYFVTGWGALFKPAAPATAPAKGQRPLAAKGGSPPAAARKGATPEVAEEEEPESLAEAGGTPASPAREKRTGHGKPGDRRKDGRRGRRTRSRASRR